MNKTQEQLEIIQSVQDHHLTKVVACAGTGKTFTLEMVAEDQKPKLGLYIAFQKVVAVEAADKFPSSVMCSTIDAFCMKYIPRMEISNFNYRNISEKIPYAAKIDIVAAMEGFFGSDSVCMEEYFDKTLTDDNARLAIAYIHKMIDKEIPATFGFTKKYFHLMLDEGLANVPEFDLIMLDEAGDVTGVTLAIFRLLEAKRKVMVGDPYQNIFGFMNTIDGFKIMENEGNLCTLSKSFRVEASIAERVQTFCQLNIDKNFFYEGIEYDKPVLETELHIFRTNSAMVGHIIYLVSQKQPFTLLRKPAEIFALPLAIITAMSGREVYDTRYKWLEGDMRIAKKENKSLPAYLSAEYKEDIPLMGALNLLRKHSFGTIFDTYNHVKNMKPHPKITLGSAHSVKGLERDIVYIDDSMNDAVLDIQEKGGPENQEDISELNLGYVAATRAKHSLRGCRYL